MLPHTAWLSSERLTLFSPNVAGGIHNTAPVPSNQQEPTAGAEVAQEQGVNKDIVISRRVRQEKENMAKRRE